jgi:hypothetical protein
VNVNVMAAVWPALRLATSLVMASVGAVVSTRYAALSLTKAIVPAGVVLLILPFSPIAYHDRTPFASPQPKWDLSASLSTHISFDWHLQSHTKSSVHLRCASHTLIPVNNQVATVKTFWQTKPRESKLFPTTIEFALNTDYRIAHACIGLQLRGVSYIKRVGWLSFLAISLCLLRNNSCEELCCRQRR